jgi:polysaccharide pyruvyl transferase WcaK-like protein
MNVGLVGYYGYNNYGDDIFLETWREKLGFHRAVTITPNDNLDNIDKIIIGGGDLIWQGACNNNYFNEKWFENNRKVYVYGIGCADTTLKEFADPNIFRLYQYFLSKAEYVSARDQASYEWLRDVMGIEKVQWVEDIAWNYKSRVSENKGNRTVGITYRRNNIYFFKEMIPLCIHILDQNKDIKFIPLQNGYHNTIQLNQALHDEIQRVMSYPNIIVIPTHYDTQHKYSYIRSCNYYITCAFHGLITALKERVPVISLVHSNKFKQLIYRAQMPEILVNKDDLYNKVEYLFSDKYTFNEEWLKTIENKAKVQMNAFINEYINN